MDFPGGSDSKESACSVGDLGLIPESGRSPGEGNGNPLQNSCLENSMARGAWQATVHGVAKGQTRLSNVRFWSRQNCNDCTLTKNHLERKFTLVFSFFAEFDVMFTGFQIFCWPT